MKINKLTASFGKLENESLSLHSGLNVIYAPNESGKSTWCAFIRAMLYGVDTAERSKAGHLPDKLRYAPWSGAPMEGSMELTADGCDITIRRSTKSKSAPMREFSATYTGSNVAVEGMNGSNAGELLCGVEREVFRRSAFVEQGSVAVSGSVELEKRINAIVTTGEEQCSYSEADERLRAWQRKRRYNRRGMLPELEARMDETQQRLSELSGSADRQRELEAEFRQAKKLCAQLEADVADSRMRQRKMALQKLNEGRAELKAQSALHDKSLEELSLRRDELRAHEFGDIEPLELQSTAAEDMKQLSLLSKSNSGASMLLPALLCFVLAAAMATVYAIKKFIPLIIIAVLFAAGAVYLFFRYSKAKNAMLAAEEQRRQILKKYGAVQSSDIQSMLDEHEALWEAVREAEQAERLSRGAYERAQTMHASLEETAIANLDFVGGDTEAARLSRELSAARQEAERIGTALAELKGRQSSMGDPLVLSSALSRMEEDYDRIIAEYEAISLATELLRDADAELQSRFAPALGRLAAKYMASVTGGKYEDVLLNRDFSALTRTKDDVVAREAEYLSAGTLDLMYLAVRLAVCELALPEGESCPLIIDDALVNLDEERSAQAIELLREIAKKRQVILFTCKKI